MVRSPGQPFPYEMDLSCAEMKTAAVWLRTELYLLDRSREGVSTGATIACNCVERVKCGISFIYKFEQTVLVMLSEICF